MDGNGRWATQRGLPRLSGHTQGVATVKEVINGCPKLGVDTVTLFAFAIANWKREKEEVDGLWVLFHTFISQDVTELVEKGVRVIVIGDKEGLPAQIQQAVTEVEQRSEHNTEFLLQIALNYDGVDEVARLIKKVVRDAVSEEDITLEYVQDNLDTQKGNEPDIVIRTGMQHPKNGMAVWRSSAFLPIQSAQAVCVSTEVLWPDFSVHHLEEIIAYADPHARLFGGQRSEVTSVEYS